MQKRLLLFYSHQQLHSDMLVQPTRFPGTAGMRLVCTRTHAAVYPPVGNPGVLPYIAHQNPDPADQGLPGAAQDTKGPPTCSHDT